MAEFEKPYRNFVAPSPRAWVNSEFGPIDEGGLKREKSRLNQTRQDTKTLIWGERDALPLMILDAVNKSPTTSSCVGKIEKFIRGSGFSDKGLGNMVIDDEGTTLLQFHQQLCGYLAPLDGFSVNFKYNEDSEVKITNAYVVPIESCRFKKPEEETTRIDTIFYNPYVGTAEYAQYQSDEYPIFDLNNVQAEIAQFQDKYKGQIYFYGRTRPPYKFYPVPKYWSGQYWIYVDGQIQEFHKENLSNGFFQSALLNVIGDPNEMSQDPRYMKKVTGTDGTTRDEPTHTVGEVFNIEMGKTFSGVKKAGSVMTMWSLNEDQFVKVSAFPVNTNFDVMSGTFTDAIRGITIATEVPAILANLPQQQNSLGSDGNAMRAAIQLMQANAQDQQSILEQFYNNVLIPNHVNGSATAKVKILPYSPVTTNATVDTSIWPALTLQEKRNFIKENTGYEILLPDPAVKDIDRDPYQIPVDPPKGAPVVTPGQSPTQPADPNLQPQQPQVNEALKGLKASEINRVISIVNKYEKGSLTLDQAKQLLTSYGFNEEQITAWLTPTI